MDKHGTIHDVFAILNGDLLDCVFLHVCCLLRGLRPLPKSKKIRSSRLLLPSRQNLTLQARLRHVADCHAGTHVACSFLLLFPPDLLMPHSALDETRIAGMHVLYLALRAHHLLLNAPSFSSPCRKRGSWRIRAPLPASPLAAGLGLTMLSKSSGNHRGRSGRCRIRARWALGLRSLQ